jgi:hypothetical protein
MIIGYAVIEDSAHHAFLEGLRQRTRWCPYAQTVLGGLRGQTGKSLRREIRDICLELNDKGVDVMIFLRDANIEAWREVKNRERNLVPAEYQHITIYGVADRNIECWLAADREYLARQLNIDPAELDVDDPSRIIKSRLGTDKFSQIVAIVRAAPVRNWISNSKSRNSGSFERFYDDVLDMSQQLGCNITNEREGA